jgi:hypothetical protein
MAVAAGESRPQRFTRFYTALVEGGPRAAVHAHSAQASEMTGPAAMSFLV